METHSSILAWESPWTEEPAGLQSMGSQRVENNSETKQVILLTTTMTSAVLSPPCLCYLSLNCFPGSALPPRLDLRYQYKCDLSKACIWSYYSSTQKPIFWEHECNYSPGIVFDHHELDATCIPITWGMDRWYAEKYSAVWSISWGQRQGN